MMKKIELSVDCNNMEPLRFFVCNKFSKIIAIFFLIIFTIGLSASKCYAESVAIQIKNSTKNQIVLTDIKTITKEDSKRGYHGEQRIVIDPGDTKRIATNDILKSIYDHRKERPKVSFYYTVSTVNGKDLHTFNQGFFICHDRKGVTLSILKKWAGKTLGQDEPEMISSKDYGSPYPRTGLIASTFGGHIYRFTGKIDNITASYGYQWGGSATIEIKQN